MIAIAASRIINLFEKLSVFMNFGLNTVDFPKKIDGRLKLDYSTSPVENFKGTLDPLADTRIYPCISWCKAEQKSVQ